MGTSEYSKGKGNRRFPGRPGGARKYKEPVWRSRASHSVESNELLGVNVAVLEYRGAWGLNPSEKIYLLDQEYAHQRIEYAVQPAPNDSYAIFLIYVRESDRLKANEIIAELERYDNKPPQPQRVNEEPEPEYTKSIISICPEAVPIHLKNQTWEFALYSESLLSKIILSSLFSIGFHTQLVDVLLHF